MTKIKFTRHAKNNMRLYNISEDDVNAVIDKPDEASEQKDKTISIKHIENRFSNMPLKVVHGRKKEVTIIITTYPVRKSYKKGKTNYESKL
ncbi:MAG: DUF4258 domain-containing protein [bacterium]